jgi:K+-transporting ATPase KdpF subunit
VNIAYLVLGIIAFVLILYLFFALLRPERF